MENQNELSVKQKTQTKAGRPISHFTLLVIFKPNNKYKNPKFTYRGDEKLEYFNATKATSFCHEFQALEYQAKIIMDKASEITLWDNSFPKPHNIYKKWLNGELIEDHSKEYIIQGLDLLRKLRVYEPKPVTRTKVYYEPAEEAKANVFETVVRSWTR